MQKAPEIMIIPMIDIVFFLLVFFMVSSLYMNTEQQIPLNLPKASSTSTKNIEPITITLKANGAVYLGKEPVHAGDLEGKIKALVQKDTVQAFVVRADKHVVYDKVIGILDVLKLSGAKYVSVATDRK